MTYSVPDWNRRGRNIRCISAKNEMVLRGGPDKETSLAGKGKEAGDALWPPAPPG